RSTHDAGCSTCGGGTPAYAAAPAAVAPPVAARPTAASPYAAARPAVVVRAAEVNHEMAAPPAAAPRPLPMQVAPPAVPAPYAAAGYYHSADYGTLVGELYYNPRQDTWRLRFAAVDEEDRYGGSVSLHN